MIRDRMGGSRLDYDNSSTPYRFIVAVVHFTMLSHASDNLGHTFKATSIIVNTKFGRAWQLTLSMERREIDSKVSIVLTKILHFPTVTPSTQESKKY